MTVVEQTWSAGGSPQRTTAPADLASLRQHSSHTVLLVAWKNELQTRHQIVCSSQDPDATRIRRARFVPVRHRQMAETYLLLEVSAPPCWSAGPDTGSAWFRRLILTSTSVRSRARSSSAYWMKASSLSPGVVHPIRLS